MRAYSPWTALLGPSERGSALTSFAERARSALEAPEVLQQLAAVEHERWSHWQRYLHSKCARREDGSLIIPAELVDRWEGQMETPYFDLSFEEQLSDQKQVNRYLPVIIDALRSLN